MNDAVATPKPSLGRIGNIVFWILRIVFGLIFLGAAAAKFAGVPMMVEEFEIIGLGQWFRYVTGGVEALGAILLLWPSTVVYGALLLLCVSIGAFVAQFTILKQDVVHTIVFAVVLAIVAWAYRRQLPFRSA